MPNKTPNSKPKKVIELKSFKDLDALLADENCPPADVIEAIVEALKPASVLTEESVKAAQKFQKLLWANITITWPAAVANGEKRASQVEIAGLQYALIKMLAKNTLSMAVLFSSPSDELFKLVVETLTDEINILIEEEKHITKNNPSITVGEMRRKMAAKNIYF